MDVWDNREIIPGQIIEIDCSEVKKPTSKHVRPNDILLRLTDSQNLFFFQGGLGAHSVYRLVLIYISSECRFTT